MWKFLRRVLGVIVGMFVGASVNMALIYAGHGLFPPPEGVDIARIETIDAHLGEYTPMQFAVPFVAHAAGTLIGAIIATIVGGYKGRTAGIIVGLFFLAGGIMMVRQMPNTPLWFAVVDLGFAYIPMGLLGWWIVRGRR
jgi:hypothetical protein